MKRHRYHLTPHAKDETIPLRTGVIPRANKVFLDEIEIDDEGTAQQTKGQRDDGKYHILANVWLSEFGDERLPGRWRLVTVEPDQDFHDPPIITLLPAERNSAKSAQNLTDYLRNARREGDKPWLTPEYIATTLHSLLMNGQIRNQNDLANHLIERLMQPVIAAKDAAERMREEELQARFTAERDRDLAKAEIDMATKAKESAERDSVQAREAKELAELNREKAEREKLEAINRVDEVSEKNKILVTELEQMAKALADIRERSSAGQVQSTAIEVARAVTSPWPSKTGSDYMNIGIEATLDDVRQIGSKISLTYLDRSGGKQTVTDFGYHGFVQLVYEYLKSCKDENRRAVFILTYRPDMKMRLAADTMMLANYVKLWRK